jgi:hypothetical protein
VDDALQPGLFKEAGRYPGPIARSAVDGHRGLGWNFVQAMRNVGEINVDRPRHMPGSPLVLVACVHHGHRLGAKDPCRHILDVDRLEF